MQGPKPSDTGLRYFVAISENKRQDVELKNVESKIDGMKKKMLTQYWKDKINIFDEMIRLNVKTPSYERDRSSEGQEGDNHMSLGPMNIDSKLLSNRPITLQRGTKQGARMEPVISVEGTYAVCYPNKEARKGRRVGLNARVLRRMEQCKTLEDSIASIKNRDRSLEYNNPYGLRPKTAPSKFSSRTPRKNRPATTAAGHHSMDDADNLTKGSLDEKADQRPVTASAEITRRPSTSFSASKRDCYLTTPALTDLKTSRSSTSFSTRKDR